VSLRLWNCSQTNGVSPRSHSAAWAVGRYRHTDLLAQEVRFVAMDLTRDDLAMKLGHAGYDSRKSSFWLWEGRHDVPDSQR
jgi:hypothetical protein